MILLVIGESRLFVMKDRRAWEIRWSEIVEKYIISIIK